MRILMLHNRYKMRGGEDEVALAEHALLSRAGHDVKLIELSNESIPEGGSLKAGVEAIWSYKSYKLIEQELASRPADLIHIQNFFPLWSPSVYYAANAAGTAVVQTVHNYRLVCPAATLFRDHQHCELCIGKTLAWPAISNRCYQGSRLGSAAVATMTALHSISGTWQHRIDQYIALSSYVRDKLILGGFPGERITVKPNFIQDPKETGSCDKQSYFVYAGRLTEEKGLDTLFDAWRRKRSPGTLRVIGAGVLELPDDAQKLGISFHGPLALNETYEQIRNARALILPAKWAEPFGRVIIEAFALGTPVICSNAGALPSIVEHGVTGLIFSSGESLELGKQIDRLISDDELCSRLGKNARQRYEMSFTADENYKILMGIYSKAIENRRLLTKAKGL